MKRYYLKNVNLAITNKCPMNCAYCYKTKEGEELSTVQLIEIIGQLVEMGVRNLYLAGGEPFVREDVIDLIKFGKDKGLTVYLATNGILLNDKNLRDVKESSLDLLFLSYDDPYDEQYYNKSLLKVLDSKIERINSYKIPLIINFIVTSKNVYRLEKIFKYFKERDIKRVSLIRAKPGLDRNWFVENRLNQEQIKWLRDNLRDLKRATNMNIYLDCAFGPLYYGVHADKLYWKSYYLCQAGMNYLRIEPDGAVYPCPYFIGKIEELGNIRRESIEKIWNENLFLQELRENRPPKTGRCSDCYIGEFCTGCRAIAYFDTKSWFASEPDCPYTGSPFV